MLILDSPSPREDARKAARSAVPEFPTVLASIVSVGGGIILRNALGMSRPALAVSLTVAGIIIALVLLRVLGRHLDDRSARRKTRFVSELAEIASACAASDMKLHHGSLARFIEEIERGLESGTVVDVLTHDIEAYDSIPIVQQQLADNMYLGIRFRYFVPDDKVVHESLLRHLNGAAKLIAAKYGIGAVEAAEHVIKTVEIYSVPERALYYFAVQDPGDGRQVMGLWYLSAPDADSTPDGTIIVWVELDKACTKKLRDVFLAMRDSSSQRKLRWTSVEEKQPRRLLRIYAGKVFVNRA